MTDPRTDGDLKKSRSHWILEPQSAVYIKMAMINIASQEDFQCARPGNPQHESFPLG